MTTALAIVALALLFDGFVFVRRERGGSDCTGCTVGTDQQACRQCGQLRRQEGEPPEQQHP